MRTATIIFLIVLGIGVRALGTPPTIHVTWNTSPGPQQPDDYVITTSDADFPNIELKTGAIWTIWLTDPDNTGDNQVGDIGIISSPHPENFTVVLDGGDGKGGARHIKGIVLDPQGTGSDNNSSSLAGGKIAGNLEGNLSVQKSSGGTGGDVDDFTIQGNVNSTSTVTIPVLTELTVQGNWAGTGNIADAVDFTVNGDVSGSLDIANVTNEFDVGLSIGDDITSTGDLTIEEVGTHTRIDIGGDVAASGSIEIGRCKGDAARFLTW